MLNPLAHLFFEIEHTKKIDCCIIRYQVIIHGPRTSLSRGKCGDRMRRRTVASGKVHQGDKNIP